MNSKSITNLPILTLPHKAANKLYVDSILGKFYRDTFHLYDRWVSAIILS